MSWNSDGTNDGAYSDIKEWERERAQFEKALDSESFNHLMQTFRHTPITDQVGLEEAYEAVKAFLRRVR